MASRSGELHAKLAIKRTMNVRREEYLDHMTFRANERPIFDEIWGPLVGLKEEWAAQGASPAELEMSAFPYRRALMAGVRVSAGYIGGCEPALLEETDDYIIERDRYGRRVKLVKGSATIALPMDHPVANMDDWLKVKPHYEFSEERFQPGWEQAAREAREAGYVITLNIPGGFDEPRQLLGEEALCLAYHEQPEMVHDMLLTMGETAFRLVDAVTRAAPIDQLGVHEDMAGKSGPLAGPRQVTEFIRPYYRKVWDLARERGARLFSQDSDGNMDAVTAAFVDAGINVMYPMEPAAGMDMVRTRRQFGPKLAFMGGIDKHVLRRGHEAITAELEHKIPPMVRTGGCVLALDHRIPNGTPLEAYRFYVAKAWEIMNRENARK